MRVVTRVALVFGPQCEPFQPYASLPYLTGHLRHHGIDVLPVDANVESFHYILAGERVASCASAVATRARELRTKAARSEGEIEELAALARPALLGSAVAAGIDAARDALRSWRAIDDYDLYARSWRLVQEAFRVVGAASYPVSLAANLYGPARVARSLASLLRASEDAGACPFSAFFDEVVVPRIADYGPDLVGFSVASAGQALPSLVLARKLRSALGGKVHLSIGGTFYSRFRDALVSCQALFDLVDSVVLHEGETALLALARAASTGGPNSAPPNTILRIRGVVRVGADLIERFDELSSPDAVGLPLDAYVAPAPIHPLFQSRGCYWNRCTFCNHRGLKVHEEYRPRSPERLYGDVESLVRRSGMRYFTLWDEAVDPKAMRTFAERLVAGGLAVEWRCVARFEGYFTRDLCELMSRAGCRGILFGFESGCARVLQNMQKGTSLETTRDVLASCRAAGISTYLSAMVGYPGETREEANSTVEFVAENIENIDHVALSTYALARGSTIERDPESFGIGLVDRDPSSDLALHFEFTACEGMSRSETEEMHEEMFATLNALGVSAYNLAHSGPHFLFFASRGEAGRISARSIRERYRTGTSGGGSEARPRIATHVVVDPESLLAFDSSRCRTFQLSPDLLALVALCDGERTVAAIAEELARRDGLAATATEPAVVRSIDSLWRYGIVDVPGRI